MFFKNALNEVVGLTTRKTQKEAVEIYCDVVKQLEQLIEKFNMLYKKQI